MSTVRAEGEGSDHQGRVDTGVDIDDTMADKMKRGCSP